MDVPVSSKVACPDRPFTPFGTWRITPVTGGCDDGNECTTDSLDRAVGTSEAPLKPAMTKTRYQDSCDSETSECESFEDDPSTPTVMTTADGEPLIPAPLRRGARVYPSCVVLDDVDPATGDSANL